jgi:hypothetical protein
VKPRSVLDAPGLPLESAELEQAVAFARENGQLVLWDRSSRPYAVAVYEEERKRLRPLSDPDGAIILNRDPSFAREWLKWSGMTGNLGSLIILDEDRVRRVLREANEKTGEDDVNGLA